MITSFIELQNGPKKINYSNIMRFLLMKELYYASFTFLSITTLYASPSSTCPWLTPSDLRLLFRPHCYYPGRHRLSRGPIRRHCRRSAPCPTAARSKGDNIYIYIYIYIIWYELCKQMTWLFWSESWSNITLARLKAAFTRKKAQNMMCFRLFFIRMWLLVWSAWFVFFFRSGLTRSFGLIKTGYAIIMKFK